MQESNDQLTLEKQNLLLQIKEREDWLYQKDVQIENEKLQFEKRIKPLKPLVKVVDKLRKIKSQIKKKLKK